MAEPRERVVCACSSSGVGESRVDLALSQSRISTLPDVTVVTVNARSLQVGNGYLSIEGSPDALYAFAAALNALLLDEKAVKILEHARRSGTVLTMA